VSESLPIVDDTLRRLTKGAGGVFLLSEKAAGELSVQLKALEGKPQYQEALQQLATLAYMLSEKKKSKAASAAIMDVVQKAVGHGKAPPKKSSGGGWGPKKK
jgi:hypothetical protein